MTNQQVPADDEQERAGHEHLAAALRRAWQESGLSLGEVARLSGQFTDRSYLTRAFNGKQSLALPALKAVAEALGLDYRQLLEEANLDEATYRSRHRKTETPSTRRAMARSSIHALLLDELRVVRHLKEEGRPEEARGAIAAARRIITYQHGGFPADHDTLLTWAALLLERVGIVQDIQLPHTVLPTAERDLADILAIANEYDAEDLRAVGHFYAGDAHFKAEDYTGAIEHYEQAADHAPTIPVRMRSLTGHAISLAHLQRAGDGATFQSLRGQVQDLLGAASSDSLVEYVWDAERWLHARLWAEETMGRALVLVGQRTEAERDLEQVRQYFEQTPEVRGWLPFEISLARSRFLAACQGVFDMSEADILELGVHAYRLAEAGSSARTKREVTALMRKRFGETSLLNLFQG